MTAREIRDAIPKIVEGGTPAMILLVEVLGEIGAQLAEINEREERRDKERIENSTVR